MFGYQLKLAWRSALQTPGVSLICVLAIALGVSVFTSMAAIRHLLARNPLPEQSERLFNIRLDTWDPDTQFFNVPPGEPPKATTYRDMRNLMALGGAERQTGVANAFGYIFPEDDRLKPYQDAVQLVHSDFFSMFRAPFRFGSAWSREDDAKPAPAVVLSQKANDALFGGENSVGQSFRIGALTFQVVGVLDQYRPVPVVFDPVNNLSGPPRDFYIPLEHIRNPNSGLSITGNTDGWGDAATFRDPDYLAIAEFYWIQHWVELASGEAAGYRALVDDYCREQKALGRYPRPLNNRVTPMMDWVEQRNQGLGVANGVAAIALLFLCVCAINLMGLLLGKFLSRASLIGVHRALGASRRAVFTQHILECEVIGIVGGAVGIGLAALALTLVDRITPGGMARQAMAVFLADGRMAAVAIGSALLAGLLAGLYPAWRACRVSPAIQLKV